MDHRGVALSSLKAWSLSFFPVLFVQDRVYIALAVLGLYKRLGWPELREIRSSCLCLPSVGIKGVCHYHPTSIHFFKLLFDCPVNIPEYSPET